MSGFDVTGMKVWEGSRALTRLMAPGAPQSASFSAEGARLLELGTGVGLAGIYAAKQFGAKRTVLTDFAPEILDLLRSNVALNFPNGGQSSHSHPAYCCFSDGPLVHKLDWRADQTTFLAEVGGRFDVIFGSDIMYASSSSLRL